MKQIVRNICATVLLLAVLGIYVYSIVRDARPALPRIEEAAEPHLATKTNGAAQTQFRISTLLTRFSSNDAVAAGLSLRLAEFWTNLANLHVQCQLCPRRCIIPNGFRGECRARVNIDGQLRTLVYGRAVSVNVDPIEKKPLFHVKPTSRTFSIATAGCNLRCVFCQNWEISQAFPERARFIPLSPQEVVEAAFRSGCDSIAYTYTEPTIFFEYMRDTARLARQHGLRNIWVTCGYIEDAPLRELCTYLDAANVDLKGFTDLFYNTYTSGVLPPVLHTFVVLKEQGVWTELTNLLIPGANDDPAGISNMCQWIVNTLGVDVPVHFSRFHPNFRLQDRPLTPLATISTAISIAKSFGIHFVYTGNVAGDAHESTYCPACGALLIKRRGYMVDIGQMAMNAGTCGACGCVIPGVWQ
jgi:pyruvate formate lyase activating enzyme